LQKFKLELDTSGLICPQPLLKTKQALKQLACGEVLKVICTDPSSEVDFKVLSETTAHKLLDSYQQDLITIYFIQKGG